MTLPARGGAFASGGSSFSNSVRRFFLLTSPPLAREGLARRRARLNATPCASPSPGAPAHQPARRTAAHTHYAERGMYSFRPEPEPAERKALELALDQL